MSNQNTNINEDMYSGSYQGSFDLPFLAPVTDRIAQNPMIVLVILVVLVVIIIFLLFAYVFVAKENYMAIGGAQARLQNNQNWQESFASAPKKYCGAKACDKASKDDLETLGYNSWAPYASQSRQLASTAPVKEGFESTDSRFFAGMMTGQ